MNETTNKIDWTKPLELVHYPKSKVRHVGVFEISAAMYRHVVEFNDGRLGGTFFCDDDGKTLPSEKRVIRNATPAFTPTPHEPLPGVTMWQDNIKDACDQRFCGMLKIDGEWDVYWGADNTFHTGNRSEDFTYPRGVMAANLDLTKLAAHAEKVRAERKAKAEPPKPVADEPAGDIASRKLVPADDIPTHESAPVYNQETMMGAWVNPGYTTEGKQGWFAVTKVSPESFVHAGSIYSFPYSTLTISGWQVRFPGQPVK